MKRGMTALAADEHERPSQVFESLLDLFKYMDDLPAREVAAWQDRWERALEAEQIRGKA